MHLKTMKNVTDLLSDLHIFYGTSQFLTNPTKNLDGMNDTDKTSPERTLNGTYFNHSKRLN